MRNGGASLYSSAQFPDFRRARTMRFADESLECVDFPPGHVWLVKNVMPVNYDRYCVVATPYDAYQGDTSCHCDSFEEPYRFFQIPLPHPLTLQRWRSDFQIIEQAHVLPAHLRIALKRAADDAKRIFVKYSRARGEADYWQIESEIFFELPEPFEEMPERYGEFSIFPDTGTWFIENRDDMAFVYLAGSVQLIQGLETELTGRILPVSLDDLWDP